MDAQSLVHRLYRQEPSKMPFTPTMAAMIKTSAPSASNTQRPPLLDARISSIVGSDCSGCSGTESEVAPAISTDYRSTALQTPYASCKPDAYPHEPKTLKIQSSPLPDNSGTAFSNPEMSLRSRLIGMQRELRLHVPPFPRIRARASERPGAVKGAPLLRGEANPGRRGPFWKI